MVARIFDFGKYMGKDVSQVDTGYLRWCLRECECLDAPLRAGILDELARRHGGSQQYQQHQQQTRQEPPRYPPPVDLTAVIKRWHREMVMRFHPDRYGEPGAMRVLNQAFDRLRELAKAEGVQL